MLQKAQRSEGKGRDLARYREVLGSDSTLSDQELEAMIDELTAFVEIVFDTQLALQAVGCADLFGDSGGHLVH